MTENSDIKKHEESVFWCFLHHVFEYLMQICIIVIVSITLCLGVYAGFAMILCFYYWNNCILLYLSVE